MSKAGKVASIAVLVLLVVASLFAVKPAVAQSIPKPSVPEFTVQFVNASYSIPTTNPYTGTSGTQQVNNNSIEISIKNQPFYYSSDSSVYQIYFNIRAKPHFAGNWTEIYPLVTLATSYSNGSFPSAEYLSPDSPVQSNSKYSNIAYSVIPTDLYQASGYDIQRYYSSVDFPGGYSAFLYAIPAGGQLDVQVEALVGHASQVWIIQHPFYPAIGGHSEDAAGYDVASGWSNTETITIGDTGSAATPSNSPLPSSSLVSQNPAVTPPILGWVEIVVLALLGVIAVLLVFVVVYLHKRS